MTLPETQYVTPSALLGFGVLLMGLFQQLVLFCAGGMLYRYLTRIQRGF